MTQRAYITILAVLLAVSAAGSARAQFVFGTPTPTPTPRPSPRVTPTPVTTCPKVTVQGQGQQVREGQRVFFTANIAGGDPRVVATTLWSTSAGFILSGQNTRRIEVDTKDAGNTQDRDLRAEVWVGGYSGECMVQGSASIRIIPPAQKFGDFAAVDEDTLKKHIETLANFMKQSPDNLYLIGYAGRNSERNFTFSWINRIREGLVMAGLEPRRINAVDGGFREEPMFDFWTVPMGAEPPRPMPTVKRSEIVYPRTTPSANGPPVRRP